MWSPSYEDVTDVTEFVCPADGVSTALSVVASHTQIVLPSEPETMRAPSGEKATDVTQSVCPSNGLSIGSPVLASHTRIVQFHEPETMRAPSGENATEVTRSPICVPLYTKTRLPPSPYSQSLEGWRLRHLRPELFPNS